MTARFLGRILRTHLLIVPICLNVIVGLRPAFSQESAEKDSVPRLRLGLALAGGGTRGCAHIGVLRVLEREKIKFGYLSGTSMGAIVGGMHLAGVPLDDIEKMIFDRSLLHSFDTVPIPVRVAAIPVFFLPRLFFWHPYDGLYRGKRFADFIRKQLPKSKHNIEDLDIPFAAVASNLLDAKSYAIKNGDLAKAIQASSALPFLRRPVELDGKLFIDGGMTSNIPVDACRDLGADIVIAVDVDDDLHTYQKSDFRKIGSTIRRAINMHLCAVGKPELKNADLVIHPDVTGVGLLSRNLKDVARSIKAGEEAAEKALPELKRLIAQRRELTPALSTNKLLDGSD